MIDLRGSCYMTCDECPNGRDIIYERYQQLKDYVDWQPEYCWCDKIVASCFLIGGYCEDALILKEKKGKYVGKRKTGNEYRRKMKLKKFNRLVGIISKQFMPYAGYIEYDWIDNKQVATGKYIKYPKNSNRQRWMKRYSNKRVRHNKDIPNGSAYRRVFDYWWEMD